MEIHEMAGIFPMMNDAEYAALKADMAANGLLEDIWIQDEKIVDGRHRYRACIELGIEPRYREWAGEGNPVEFILSMNLHRRHLNESQRALVASRIANMSVGRPDINTSNDVFITQSEAAKMMNISVPTIQRVAKIEREAPELILAIESGELRVSKAIQQVNRVERVERIQEVSEFTVDIKYPVIYADPPWRYEHTKTDNRRIENQYPTMALDDICGLKVGDLATPDAVLFLWVTNPKLGEALQVIEAWEFTYRTNMVWVKDRIGMGYFARQQHELLLIATRGNVPVPEPKNRVASVLHSPRQEHSKKPEEYYGIIESMYPEYKKIELFSRMEREGWEAWGNQV